MDFFKLMSKFTGEGIFKRYKFFKGLRILSGCLYCEGALIWKKGEWSPDKRGVFVCFNCGRMYLSFNGNIRLWPYREYEHLVQKNKFPKQQIQRIPKSLLS